MFSIRIVCALALLLGVFWLHAASPAASVARGAPLSAAIASGHHGAYPSGWLPVEKIAKKQKRSQRAFPPIPQRAERRAHNVSLRAALTAGAPALNQGLSWRVFKLGEPQAEPELIWSGGGAEPRLTLKPGRYDAEATYGLAKNNETFEVEAKGTVSRTVSLDAGTLFVHAAAVAGGAPLDNVFFALRRDKANDGAERGEDSEIGRSTLPEAVFHVPAGHYRLTAKHGLASVETPISLAPGEERRVEAVMNSGRLTLAARAKEDSPVLSGATYFIFENSEADGPREVIRSKLDEPSFSLPAGRYRVAAVLGLARAEEDVTVEPGEEKKQDLVLDTGGVRLSSILAGNARQLDANLLYRVYSLSPENGAANQELLTSTLPSPTLFLPSGRYRIESHYGWHNARQTREVDVTAGEVKDVVFEHKASDVKLRLVDRPGGQPMERVKWTLKYNGGGTVLISQDAQPMLILQAGSYQAMAQHDAKTYTQTFEANSNQEQVVEIVAQ